MRTTALTMETAVFSFAFGLRTLLRSRVMTPISEIMRRSASLQATRTRSPSSISPLLQARSRRNFSSLLSRARSQRISLPKPSISFSCLVLFSPLALAFSMVCL
ncbi:hypothetical protein BDV11DRAFT_187528 [Aspergillus similis]